MTDARDRLIAEIVQEMSAGTMAARRHGLQRLIGKSVSITHLHVLSILRIRGPLPVSDVARALDVSVPAATGIVSRMVERGLVQRRRDDADRRVVTIVLAPGGETALAQIEGRGREYLSRLLARLGGEELRQLRLGMRALGRAREQAEREAEATPSTRTERSA